MTWRLIYCSELVALAVGSYLLRPNIYAILIFLLITIIVDCNVLINDLSASCLHLRVVPAKHIWVSPGIPLR